MNKRLFVLVDVGDNRISFEYTGHNPDHTFAAIECWDADQSIEVGVDREDIEALRDELTRMLETHDSSPR